MAPMSHERLEALIMSSDFVRRVRALRNEAADAGDLSTVADCDRVLTYGPDVFASDGGASFRCAETLLDAAGQS